MKNNCFDNYFKKGQRITQILTIVFRGSLADITVKKVFNLVLFWRHCLWSLRPFIRVNVEARKGAEINNLNIVDFRFELLSWKINNLRKFNV